MGGATQDIFILYEQAESAQIHDKRYIIFEEGKKLEVNNLHYATGGGALNAAATFHKLGFLVYPLCKIGNDAAGAFIKNAIHTKGISTVGIVTDDAQQTGTSFVLPSPSGDRAILAYRGANAELREHEIPATLLHDAEYMYIASLAKKSSHLLSTLCKQAHHNRTFVAANPGLHQLTSSDTIMALKHIDLLTLNMFEAKTFLATFNKSWDLQEYFKTIHAQGPRIVVVTDGAKGVYVSTPEKEYFAPSIPTKVINTVGAGDAFAACFIGMLAHGHDISIALHAGVINSSSVLQHADAQQGILDYTQIMKRVAA